MEACQVLLSSCSCRLACAGLRAFKLNQQVHSFASVSGFAFDSLVQSSLVHLYLKCYRLRDAHNLFDKIAQRDVVTWSALIASYSRRGCIHEVKQLFYEMRSMGVEPNLVSWNGVIVGFSGSYNEAVFMFQKMHFEGFQPDGSSISSVLPAIGNLEDLVLGIQIHGYVIKQGFDSDKCVVTISMASLSRNGQVNDALEVCRQFKGQRMELNVISWTSMIGSCSQNGKDMEALELFREMQIVGVKPNSVTIPCLLPACGNFAALMHGKAAHCFSLRRGFSNDVYVGSALIDIVHSNVTLGEIAARELFKLEPSNPGNYILLSNIYASEGKRIEVDKVRNMMKSLGLRKNPGCSWIELKNKVHMLLAGDKSPPQIDQIIEKLDKLSMEMKKLGYCPNTDFVLQDVEEQDEEQILCGYSEKLAVVFGLLNTSPGSPLRVIKNLRICGDCHAVIKFISNFEGREISVRDTNRFHHFKDGVCSCGDYW
ncbi:hypothetical protein SO802_008055 [Lithocarpus litseifolius]|uniref:DYW domain-containing protein n=1 Tax=Lithocarpus litseifolius TaxID=425828 RepID=A0AAW2DA20_9ROSI